MSRFHVIPGAIYKLANGVGLSTVIAPSVDVSAMRVDAVICTATVDREGDVIIPGGVNADNYAKNPVVLWDHGLNPNFSTPIAKCLNPDGTIALSLGETIEGSAYFSDKDRNSYQVFALIADGIIRATSIHVLPTVEPNFRQTSDGQITIYPQSELLEWSFGAVGVNPEAVAKVLTANKLGGETIIEPLRKLLTPYAPAKRVSSPGFDFQGAKTMAANIDPNKPKDDDSQMKGGLQASNPKDDASQMKATSAVSQGSANQSANGTGNSVEENDANGVDGDSKEAPSPRVLRGIHSGIMDLIATLDSVEHTYEDSTAKAHVADTKERLQVLADDTNAVYGQLTGGKCLTKDMDADKGADTDEMAKSFLAGGRMGRSQIAGAAQQLDRLAKSLKGRDVAAAQSIVRMLNRLVSDATKMAVSQAKTLAKPNPIQEKLNALNAEISKREIELSNLIPKNRK